jgi:hypothetical protein
MRLAALTIFICLTTIAMAQTDDGDNTPKPKRKYTLSDFRIAYTGTLYNYNSVYLSHAHDLWEFNAPEWTDCDSLMEHDNRSEIYAGLTFRKQIFSNESYFYGNLNFGIIISTGGRIKAGYKHDYFTHNDSALIESEIVTNLDTLIRYQHDYIYKSTDLGFDISYTICSPPKYIFRAETGVGFAGLNSVTGSVSFTDTYSVNSKYRDQFNRSQSFTDTETETTQLEPKSQIVLRTYIPIIMTYSPGRTKKFAITTSFMGGLDFQKPKGGNFYSYPFFSVSAGLRWRI